MKRSTGSWAQPCPRRPRDWRPQHFARESTVLQARRRMRMSRESEPSAASSRRAERGSQRCRGRAAEQRRWRMPG
eukprot:8968687-Alexandrium_andersonii.AAC.1